MAAVWIEVVTVKGPKWSMPPNDIGKLKDLTKDAEEALKAGILGGRTPVLNARVKMAFDALTDHMRYVKRLYFQCPPRTLDEMAELGLRPPAKPSPQQDPTGIAQVKPEVLAIGIHGLILESAGGPETEEESESAFFVAWGARPPGGATVEQAKGPLHLLVDIPTDPEILHHTFTTRRRKYRLIFPRIYSGMTIYYCVCYQNSKGRRGPWGPIVAIVVP
jgi:hypothetical protein